METIKPIETVYKGYRFRSRLEARWAVFFDEIGAKWEYEPEGFELPDGTKYLPDFRLKNVRGRGAYGGDIFVEIKGQLSDEDAKKIEIFAYSDGKNGYPSNKVVIFGQIPECRWYEPRWVERHIFENGVLKPAKVYEQGFWAIDYSRDEDERFYNLYYSEGDWYLTEPKAAEGGGLVLDYPDNPYGYVDEGRTIAAYQKARQARFEHGEKP